MLEKFLKHLKREGRVKKVKEVLVLIGIIATIVAAVIAVISYCYQRNEWTLQSEGRTYDLLSHINDKLTNGNNKKIAKLIEDEKPILKENGGKFTSDDLEAYLNDLSDLSDVYGRKLVDLCSIDSWFSDYFSSLDKNTEVKNYITKYREKGSTYYSGLDDILNDLKTRLKECK